MPSGSSVGGKPGDPFFAIVHGRSVERDPTTKRWVSGALNGPQNVFHACVTDPPYGIAYGEADWDTFTAPEDFRQFTRTWAADLFGVLQPGARAVVCCGQQSFATDFEAVGFVHAKTFLWYFATGLPLWEGGPKSASEVIIVMAKPGDRPITSQVDVIGPFETGEEADAAARAALKHPLVRTVTLVSEEDGEYFLTYRKAGARTDDIYVPRVTPKERDFGCEDLPLVEKARGTKARNPHPTTKPVELMRILVRRACPAGGLVIDPFAGSGTTGMACAYEGRQFWGIEQEARWVQIAQRRIAKAQNSMIRGAVGRFEELKRT